MNAKSKFQVIPMLKDIFNDLRLEDDCSEVFNNYPNMVEKLKTAEKKMPNGIKIGTKSLGKGKKSNTTALLSNCSSMHPLHPLGENREESDMEEQIPELVDISDEGDTNGDRQTLITFGQARLTNMGDTTENLSQGVNVTFEVDNENTEVSKPTCTPEKFEKSLQKK